MVNKRNNKKCKENFGLGLESVTGGINNITGSVGNILTSPLSFITDTLGLGNLGNYVRYIIIVLAIVIGIYILFKLKGMAGSSNNYQQMYSPQMYPPIYQQY